MTVTQNASAACPLLPTREPIKPNRIAPGLRYGIAHQKDDLQQAFALVYESYRHAGLVDKTECRVRLTPFHLLDTTEVFVTKLDETVVSTVSLIGDGQLGLPLESIYSKHVALIRRRGLKMAEIGCLADRRESPVRFVETFAAMGQLLAQVAMRRGYDGLVAAAHPKHARLYSRILPFEKIGEQVECPYANGNPAVMLALVFDDCRGSSVYERFFGSMSTAADTSRRPWSDETRRHFANILGASGQSDPEPMPNPAVSSRLTRQIHSATRFDR
jgi:hypothetical protein